MTPEEYQSQIGFDPNFWNNAASNTMGYDPTAFNTQYNVDANIGGFQSFDVDSNLGGFPSYNVNPANAIPGTGNMVDPTGGFKTNYNVNPEGGFKTDYQVNTGGGFKTDYNVDATGGFKTDYNVDADTSIFNQNQKVEPNESFASTIQGSSEYGGGDYTNFGGGLLGESMNRGNAVLGNPDNLNFNNLQPWQQKVLKQDSGTLTPSTGGDDMLDIDSTIAQNQELANKTNPQTTQSLVTEEDENGNKLGQGLKSLGEGIGDIGTDYAANQFQYGNIFG